MYLSYIRTSCDYFEKLGNWEKLVAVKPYLDVLLNGQPIVLYLYCTDLVIHMSHIIKPL